MKSKIDSNEVSEEQFVCPHESCPCIINTNTVQELCPRELFLKFLDFRQEKFLIARELSGSIRKCPTDTCNYKFEYVSGSSLEFSCSLCEKSYCINCKANEVKFPTVGLDSVLVCVPIYCTIGLYSMFIFMPQIFFIFFVYPGTCGSSSPRKDL